MYKEIYLIKYIELILSSYNLDEIYLTLFILVIRVYENDKRI